MASIQKPICEIHSIGRDTRERIIGNKQVPFLANFGIRLAGVSETKMGFIWTRLDPEDSQILASVSGEGEVWVNGKWCRLLPGFAYVTPVGIPHAYRAVSGREWTVCWVTYLGNLRDPSAVLPEVPVVIPCACQQLWHAVEGAFDAMTREGMEAHRELWVRLMHLTVVRILGTALRAGRRLEPLWGAVYADLARGWTLGEFARRAGMSKENVRRVCLQDLGVSPMRQLARLRMARAAELLAFTPDKLALIAARVGYSDPFSFSVAFKRETGMTPSACRRGVGSAG
jgi:AraC-like DNA-binding protein